MVPAGSRADLQQSMAFPCSAQSAAQTLAQKDCCIAAIAASASGGPERLRVHSGPAARQWHGTYPVPADTSCDVTTMPFIASRMIWIKALTGLRG
jgi:hypothetical protein